MADPKDHDNKKASFLRALYNYRSFDSAEEKSRHDFIGLMRRSPNPYSREHYDHHLTASAYVMNAALTHVLLIYHNKLKKWVQPGGHCDGETDPCKTAITEVWEETGLKNLKPIGLLDLNLYTNTQKGRYGHTDYDAAYLLIADMSEPININERECARAKWLPIEQITRYNPTKLSFKRVQEKIRGLRQKRAHTGQLSLKG